MHLTEKLCGLCADDTDVSIPLENLGNLLETQQFLLTNIVSKNILKLHKVSKVKIG